MPVLIPFQLQVLDKPTAFLFCFPTKIKPSGPKPAPGNLYAMVHKDFWS